MADKPLLYDMLTRHQIFLEGVKAFGARKFDVRLRALQKVLQELILSVPHENLGLMSRRQINGLVVQVRRKAEKIMSDHELETTDFLLALMAADLELTRKIYDIDKPKAKPIADAPIVEKEVVKSPEKLYEFAEEEPLPADGNLLPALIAGLSAGVVAALTKRVRMGYANNETPRDLLTSIVGTKSKSYRDGLMAKMYRDNSALIATGVQHVSSIVGATLASFIYKQYEWVSVIDERTTDICYDRDGRIYDYGKGPLPPAHFNCRSKTVPLADERAPSNQTYFGWLQTQPNTVLDEIMSTRDAARFKAGQLKKDDLPKFKDAKPLSISQFRAKLKTITAA